MKRAFDVRNGLRVSSSWMDDLSDRLGGRLNWELHTAQAVFDKVAERLQHGFLGEMVYQPHLIAHIHLPAATSCG